MKIALVCIARDEDDYIEEWVNYNFKIGFEKIIIYQDRWDCKLNDPRIIKLNMKSTDKGRQVGSYNDFIQEMSDSFDYAAFFDIDEFLVLKKHVSVKDFIEDYSECQSIGVPWVYFGDNGLEKVTNNDYSVVNRFTKRRIWAGTEFGVGVKQILKLDKKIPMTVHHAYCSWCSLSKSLHDGAGFPPSDGVRLDEIAQLNHYYCKTKQEFVEKKIKYRCDDNPLNLTYFDKYNFNEVEDLCAYNFFMKN